jgi:hypothetical protein
MIDKSELKNQACDLAKALLQSDDNYLDRIIEMWKIGNSLYGQVWDTEFHIFGVIESDTDHLPTAKFREHCSAEWLAKGDNEIVECINFYRKNVTEACNEILAKHGSA